MTLRFWGIGILLVCLGAPTHAIAACFHPDSGVDLTPIGDVDNSGNLNVADVMCTVLEALAQSADPADPAPACLSGSDRSLADLNCDGITNVADATLLLRVGLIGSMPTQVDADGDLCADACSQIQSIVFDTAGDHSFVVPSGVTTVDVQLWGGGGHGTQGGMGGYTEGTVAVSPGQTYTIQVQAPNRRLDGAAGNDACAGGGRAAMYDGSPTAELLVAGGGGGSCGSGSTVINFWAGGDGGGSSGGAGQSGEDANQSFGPAFGGGGATTGTPGGSGGCSNAIGNHLCPGESGSRVFGGNGDGTLHQGGAGGNGYFGGGQGGATGGALAGGGGGSGFVSASVSGLTASPGDANYNELDRGTAGDPGQLGKVIVSY